MSWLGWFHCKNSTQFNSQITLLGHLLFMGAIREFGLMIT